MTRIAMARAFANMLLFSLPYSLAAIPLAALPPQPAGVATSPAESQRAATAKSSTQSSKAALAQFAWLAGSWQGEWGPRLAQEVWLPPQSGTMVGVFQVSENTKTLVVELYTIVSTPRGIELRVRRFTPSLTAWEKSGPEVLDLKSIDSKSISFENAKDGQPKSLLMERTGTDALVERFEIVPEKGQQQIAEIDFRRQLAAAPASH